MRMRDLMGRDLKDDQRQKVNSKTLERSLSER